MLLILGICAIMVAGWTPSQVTGPALRLIFYLRGDTRSMAEKPIFLTPEGRAKLEAEVENLRTVRRAEVAERIHSAKEEGGIMENSAYDEAKNEQAFVEGRIMTIEQMLKNA